MQTEPSNQFRQRLLDLRAELLALEAASSGAKRPVELDQSSIGRLSRIDAMQNQQLARETSRRRQARLTRISSALRRLDADEYGFCLECGEAIDPRRLAIDPTHFLCVSCAESV